MTSNPTAGTLLSHGVRPPKWFFQGSSDRPTSISLAQFKNAQSRTLQMLRRCVDNRDWKSIHSAHFDWWQFPIDDGSKPEFNLKSELDLQLLLSDFEWLQAYRESIALVAYSWGWDIEGQTILPNAGHWDGKDVRLAKIIRSLWLFQIGDYFNSMQAYARHIHTNVLNGGGFFYGSICLDEILHMNLPRTS